MSAQKKAPHSVGRCSCLTRAGLAVDVKLTYVLSQEHDVRPAHEEMLCAPPRPWRSGARYSCFHTQGLAVTFDPRSHAVGYVMELMCLWLWLAASHRDVEVSTTPSPSRSTSAAQKWGRPESVPDPRVPLRLGEMGFSQSVGVPTWFMTGFPTGRPEREAVSQILAILETHLSALDEEAPAVRRSQRRYQMSNLISFAFLGGAFFLVVVASQWTVPYFGIAYPLLVFAAVVLSLFANVRVVREQSHVFGALRNPRQALLRGLSDVFVQEERTVEDLMVYPLDSLVFTRVRLLQAVDIRRERSEAVLGSASRLGLFPSVLTAVTAVLATLRNAPLWAQAAALILTGLLILNQNTATTLQMALSDARVMFGLLDRAIQLQQARVSGPADDESA